MFLGLDQKSDCHIIDSFEGAHSKRQDELAAKKKAEKGCGGRARSTASGQTLESLSWS